MIFDSELIANDFDFMTDFNGIKRHFPNPTYPSGIFVPKGEKTLLFKKLVTAESRGQIGNTPSLISIKETFWDCKYSGDIIKVGNQMAPTKYAITMEIATGLIQEPAIPPKGYFAIKSVTKIMKKTATTGYMEGRNIPIKIPCNKVTGIFIERFLTK